MVRNTQAGVPIPESGELSRVIGSADAYSMVQLDGTYSTDQTIQIPEWVDVDARNATINYGGRGTAVEIMHRGQFYGGTINYDRADIAVDVRSPGRTFCPTGFYGTTVNGSGSGTAFRFTAENNANNQVWLWCYGAANDVGTVCGIENRSGFTNSLTVGLTARGYDRGIVFRGNKCNHNHFTVDFDPGDGGASVFKQQDNGGRRNVSEGTVRDPDAHDEFVLVEETKTLGNGAKIGNHHHFSHAGLSGGRYVTDQTTANDTKVVPFV